METLCVGRGIAEISEFLMDVHRRLLLRPAARNEPVSSSHWLSCGFSREVDLASSQDPGDGGVSPEPPHKKPRIGVAMQHQASPGTSDSVSLRRSCAESVSTSCLNSEMSSSRRPASVGSTMKGKGKGKGKSKQKQDDPHGGMSSRLRSRKNEQSNGFISDGTNGAVKEPDEVNASADEESPKLQKKPPVFSKMDEELVRLIGQHLRGLGLESSAEELMRESGCRLEHPAAAKFRSHVMNGNWDQAQESLAAVGEFLANQEDLKKMQFLLLEQKYLELLETGKVHEALRCLQMELTPMNYNTPRVYQLTQFLMCASNQVLYTMAKWSGSEPKLSSRKSLMDNLQKFLPPSVMLPPDRLRQLVIQAVELQGSRCQYHNPIDDTYKNDVSLLTDHVCTSDDFPSRVIQNLTDHSDEVWFCVFSPDGKTLATGSKDTTIILWDVDVVEFKLTRRKVLEGHTYGVAFIAWSPDSHWLVACGTDDCSELWIWDARSGDLQRKISHSPDDSLTTAAFHACSKKFVAGGTKGQFYLCNLEGSLLDSWEGVRVRALWTRKDGKTVLAADTHHRIRAYIFEDPADYGVLREDHSIMSFTVHPNGQLALLNVSTQGVHLWDLETRCLVRKFRGVTQSYFTIYSCFGGYNHSYIASGSEDHKVYVWHVKRSEPLVVLCGHLRTVNCVSWNPVFPEMLVSASDDCTVKVWGPKYRARDDLEYKPANTTGVTMRLGIRVASPLCADETFVQSYPEEYDGSLDCVTLALACAFNRRGSLLAVGCNDGRLIIWDFITRGIAKVIMAHSHPLCALSWSRTGHKLLTAATDNSVCLWDVLTGDCEHRYRFPCPVLKIQFHPRNPYEFLVCPMRHPAILIDVSEDDHGPKREGNSFKKAVKGTEPKSRIDDPGNDEEIVDVGNVDEERQERAPSVSTRGEIYRKIPVVEDVDVGLAASYDHTGAYIFVGNGRGKVFIIENICAKDRKNAGKSSADPLVSIPSSSLAGASKYSEPADLCTPKLSKAALKVVWSFRASSQQTSAAAIRSIEFSRRGHDFLVNTADRVIRVYRTNKIMSLALHRPTSNIPEPSQRLQDLVNKTMWKKCCFSGDGEYICAGSARSHSLYFWEKSNGNLVKILHGTKGEVLLDVIWHPVRPIVCSISSGVVSIWAQNQVENWSAFSPEFKELDENVEYEERESEFDLNDEDRSPEVNVELQSEETEVDIIKVERITAFCSSDEDDDWDDKQLIFLPCTPDVEEPEESRPSLSTETATGDRRDDSSVVPPYLASGPGRKRTSVHDVNLDVEISKDAHPCLTGTKKERLAAGVKKFGKELRRKGKDRGK
ncbi:unnamed protein product [Notodromas monacha]|uniref:CTLH domain-containing protein n=1 Tax=Notodromas monacha TaxID=399045 RepID=A0A7R9BEN4_9CRUS|nr:unnamed protein product [Notodromas monacha]CAG0912843.1 unnamed protein product [Notodromas monacha]